MPVVDSFPTRLREDIETAYVDDLDGVFDVGAVRDALNNRLHALESELHQVSKNSKICKQMLYCGSSIRRIPVCPYLAGAGGSTLAV